MVVVNEKRSHLAEGEPRGAALPVIWCNATNKFLTEIPTISPNVFPPINQSIHHS